MSHGKINFGRTPSLVIITVLLAVNPATASVRFQYHQQLHPQYQLQQSPYFFPTQKFIAVPGKIVHHANEIAITPFSVPFQNLPLLRYELETESSSSPPEDDDSFDGNDGFPRPPNQQGPPMNPPPPPPPPQNEPPPPPPMNPPPPPPSENTEDNMEMQPSPNPHHKVIHKYISIHVPPKEFEGDDQVTVIRPRMPHPEKHVNIIFIKAPSPPPHKGKTEVILPESPQQKTLVYILVKKPEPTDGIRVRGPPPTEPSKPQVYFIRYKQNNKEEHHQHHHH